MQLTGARLSYSVRNNNNVYRYPTMKMSQQCRWPGKWSAFAFFFSSALLSSPGFSQASLPASIQAENYSHMSGVQLEATSDSGGGQNVGWIEANDWMAYSNNPVTIPTTGAYDVEYRVASQAGGGSIRLEEAGGATN